MCGSCLHLKLFSLRQFYVITLVHAVIFSITFFMNQLYFIYIFIMNLWGLHVISDSYLSPKNLTCFSCIINWNWLVSIYNCKFLWFYIWQCCCHYLHDVTFSLTCVTDFHNTVKPAYAVTSIKQSPLLKGLPFLFLS